MELVERVQDTLPLRLLGRDLPWESSSKRMATQSTQRRADCSDPLVATGIAGGDEMEPRTRSSCVFVESRCQTAPRSVAARVVISPIRFSSSETELARFSLTH